MHFSILCRVIFALVIYFYTETTIILLRYCRMLYHKLGVVCGFTSSGYLRSQSIPGITGMYFKWCKSISQQREIMSRSPSLDEVARSVYLSHSMCEEKHLLSVRMSPSQVKQVHLALWCVYFK